MLLYTDSLSNSYKQEIRENLILVNLLLNKAPQNSREKKISSALVDKTTNQVIDLGLPYRYRINSNFENLPIIHRYTHNNNSLWRYPHEWDNPTLSNNIRKIFATNPFLFSSEFFYNHTLVFAFDEAKSKLWLLALVHLSNGQLEDMEEVIAVANYFGLDYD